jgi:hypothetical protein
VISATLAVILGIGAFFPVALAGPGDGPCCVIEHTTTLAETDYALTDYLGATVIIMAITFGPAVAWLLGL